LKIGASTPYDFTGRNLAYGGLLPVATMLRAIGLGAVNFQILRRTWITELSKADEFATPAWPTLIVTTGPPG
jgi:hypothetical protein